MTIHRIAGLLMARIAILGFAILGRCEMLAQPRSADAVASVRLRMVSTLPGKQHPVPAVVWLSPLAGALPIPFESRGPFTLLQKDRLFTPHLLVVPVGSIVQFPNKDPFFHNVFSLFDGRRFDLGLYEAGSSKAVTFSREGVSYIFCNIHPEMSAVILSLSTPLYAIADPQSTFEFPRVPPGDYELHLWIEGVPQSALNLLTHHVRIAPTPTDLGTISAPIPAKVTAGHANKFGAAYTARPEDIY